MSGSLSLGCQRLEPTLSGRSQYLLISARCDHLTGRHGHLLTPADYGGSMAPADTFSAALDKLVSRLTLMTSETVRWAEPQVVRLVSQLQAKPATRTLVASVSAGSLGVPDLTEAEIRAAIYDAGRVAQQAKAFPTISCLAVGELARNVRGAISQGATLTAMGGLRAIIERIALATWLSNKLDVFSKAEAPDFLGLLDNSEMITRAVYGTGMAWITLGGADLRAIRPKDAAYRRIEDSASTERVQILGAIDLMDRRVSGLRLSYEILCDFLHPNVGDLFSATSEAKSFMDGHGTRHVERRLGSSQQMFGGAADVQLVMAQVCDIVGEGVGTYPAVLASLEQSAAVALRVSKLAAHKSFKRQRHLFGPSDLCPCNSGKTVRRCALAF